MPPVLEIAQVSKRFGQTTAVDDVSFAVQPGRVHALMGENGAGKSTLMKIVAGVLRPDTGHIAIGGAPAHFANPRAAMAAGVSTVFQELSLLPNLTIAENMFLGKEPVGRLGVPDRAAMAAQTRQALAALGMNVDPGTLVSELSIAQRQFVEIAHGINADAQLFILDEPTAALNAADVAVLNDQIRALKAADKAIIYISHRMDEIFNVCDDVTVMKDGRHVATRSLTGMTTDDLIALMVGRALHDLFPARSDGPGPVRLSCRGLRLAPGSAPISFDLHGGEIVGLAGLEGQGQGHIARSLIGQHAADAGELVIGPVTIPLPLPVEGGVRLTQRLRVGFVPEDRKAEGLLLGAAIHDNIVIARQSARPAHRLLQRFADLSGRIMADLNVKAASAAVPVSALSGGNQQKVLLGRYLAADMDVLIIEEPTRGVDIGAKSEIYRLLRQLAQAGKAVLVLSRETVELIGLCDRIMVVHGQRVVAEMPGAQASEHAILDASLNHDTTG